MLLVVMVIKNLHAYCEICFYFLIGKDLAFTLINVQKVETCPPPFQDCQMTFYECSACSGQNVMESMIHLAR